MSTTIHATQLNPNQFKQLMRLLNRFLGNYPILPSKLGRVHSTVIEAKEKLIQSQIETMFNFKKRFDEIGDTIKVNGVTFEEQLTSRFALSDDIVDEYWEMGGTINHFILFSSARTKMLLGYETALKMSSALFSFLTQGAPFPIVMAGEAILVKKMSTQLAFTNFFLQQFKQIEDLFYRCLVLTVLEKHNLTISNKTENGSDNGLEDSAHQQIEVKFFDLFKRTFPNGLDLTKPEKAIINFHNDFHQNDFLLEGIHQYLDKTKLADSKKEQTAKAMRGYLKEMGIEQQLSMISNGSAAETPDIDELYGTAYNHAIHSNTETLTSPLSNTNTDWDFSVDHFEELEDKDIEPTNIKASGALDYIYELGDQLGIFRITDTLVLLWAQGHLELPRKGEAVSKLYRYYKRRDTRISPAERAMNYKIVLNKGTGQHLSRMVPNEGFTELWQQLMDEVTTYSEHAKNMATPSKHSIFRTTHALQHNLSFNMQGKPMIEIHELYAQLQECISILSDPTIIQKYKKGSNKNMWDLIKSISEQEYRLQPNINAYRTLAVEGNKIFQWIAEFGHAASCNNDNGVITESSNPQFQSLLSAVKAYTNANRQLTQKTEETVNIE